MQTTPTQDKIIAAIRESGPMTVPQISEHRLVNTHPMVVTEATDSLRRNGLLVQNGENYRLPLETELSLVRRPSSMGPTGEPKVRYSDNQRDLSKLNLIKDDKSREPIFDYDPKPMDRPYPEEMDVPQQPKPPASWGKLG